MKMKKKIWGQLLSLDLSGCEHSVLTDKNKLEKFGIELCKNIDMIPFGKPIIKRFGQGKLKGYSLVQFIQTSSITVHLDEFDLRAFIDIFSCKTFKVNKAVNFCKVFFKAKNIRYKNYYRY